MNKKTIFKELIPSITFNILGMIGLSCYILTDTFFISKRFGAKGLTALNLAIPIYSFIHGTGLMLGIGGATKYSIYRGQKKIKQANTIYTNTIYAMVLFIIIFITIGIFFSEELTALLGAEKEVFPMTKTYLQVILLFSPAFLANDTFLCFIRNDGNPKLSMVAMLTGSLSNIVLDYLFLFPLHMGIVGAVLATSFAPIISLGILSNYWIMKQNQFHLEKTTLSLKQIKTIVSLGIPSLITEVASGIVIIIFNFILLKLEGNIGVAAYGIIANLSLVVTSIYTGIAQGIQPILSRFYGYGDRKSIKQILNYIIKFLLLLSGFLYYFFLVTANPIIRIFNSEQNILLQQIAQIGLKLYFIAIPFAGFNIILSTYFTSTEKALPAQIISLARGFLVIIPMAFLMSFFFGITGVWLSYLFTEGIVTFMEVLFYQKSKHNNYKK